MAERTPALCEHCRADATSRGRRYCDACRAYARKYGRLPPWEVLLRRWRRRDEGRYLTTA